jgi:hypothetical protein
MPTVRLRLTGSEDDACALMTRLQGVDGVEHVEEVADTMPHLNDPDSSSAGLQEQAATDVHAIEVEARDRVMAETVRRAAEAASLELPSTMEFVDVS